MLLKRNCIADDYFELPKTTSGSRTIILGRNTIDILHEHVKHHASERQAARQRWQDNDLIFPSSIGTPLNHRNVFTNFKVFLQFVGLWEIRFHDLHHTAATLMLNHGVPAIIVSKRLGHARVCITINIYGHLVPEMQDRVADRIDEIITPVAINIAHDCTRKGIRAK